MTLPLRLANECQTKAYLYPFIGLVYFFNDASLWPTFLAIFLPMVLLSTIVFWTMILILFPVYSFFATLIIGPFGFVSALFGVLQASRKVTVLLSRLMFLDRIQESVFDKILVKEGLEKLLQEFKRSKKKKAARTHVCWKKRFLSLLLREACFLVVELIPLVGPLLTIYLKAPVKTYKSHKRYYKILMWNHEQVDACYKLYHSDYLAFGFTALLLEMIPGTTVLFLFTSNIGLALWTTDNHPKIANNIKK